MFDDVFSDTAKALSGVLLVLALMEDNKAHFEACRLLAFKWVRIIYKLCKNEESYNTQHHLRK